MRQSILIIDDDDRLVDLLVKYLSGNGFDAYGATSPVEGLSQLTQRRPDLVVLDVMMPEKNGLEVCKEIRATSAVPIIMLTARGDVTDKVVGLELGADDYVGKPFDARELLARIQSVLRRTQGGARNAKKLTAGPLVIDGETRSATLDGEPLDLTTTEFEALTLFATYPGKVFSRDQIMEHLRGIDWQVYHRSADVLISRLRQKLKDDPKKPTWFKTIWGSGYMFLVQRTPEKG